MIPLFREIDLSKVEEVQLIECPIGSNEPIQGLLKTGYEVVGQGIRRASGEQVAYGCPTYALVVALVKFKHTRRNDAKRSLEG